MKGVYARRACRHLYPHCPSPIRPARRLLCNASTATTQHYSFLRAKADLEAPKNLPALLRVFEAQGHSILDPADHSGLHPLVIPLSQGPSPDASSSTDAHAIFGLLHWPITGRAPSNLSLVYTSRNGRCVNLLAKTVDEYLHRILAEEDAGGSSERPVAASVGSVSEQLYKPGTVEELGLKEKMGLYTIRKVGMFQDVCESLARGHLERGDTTSALVAGEWYMRGNNFPGWARPYEFASQVLHKLNRHEESRDTSRVALRMPWWTLKDGFQAAVEIAALRGPPEEVKFMLSEEAQLAVAALTGASVKLGEPKSAAVLAAEKANTLMDMVAARESSDWDSIREDLADKFKAAGFEQAARLVE